MYFNYVGSSTYVFICWCFVVIFCVDWLFVDRQIDLAIFREAD